MAVVSTAEAGLRAVTRGATMLQLRAPSSSAAVLEREAARLVASARVPVLVSSRCDVAIASAAAGVNLPERDISVADARALMGTRLVGRSTHSLEAAREAEAQGADFVIFGPIWRSPSHPHAGGVGLSALEEIIGALPRTPVIAIGGVTAGRAREVLDAGAAGYAAITMFE
jgi:thiamine-phosphate pyrophosphorylase